MHVPFSYTVAGRATTATIARQTSDLVVLRDSGGAEHRIVKGDIESLDRQSVSLMPSGLAQAMTREEFRDLLAFLLACK